MTQAVRKHHTGIFYFIKDYKGVLRFEYFPLHQYLSQNSRHFIAQEINYVTGFCNQFPDNLKIYSLFVMLYIIYIWSLHSAAVT